MRVFVYMCSIYIICLKICECIHNQSEVAQSCPTLCDPMDCSLPGYRLPGYGGPWGFPGKNTGVGCHFLLQGIFPTQGSNPGLLHCRQILYRLSYEGSHSISPTSLMKQFASVTCPRSLTWETVKLGLEPRSGDSWVWALPMSLLSLLGFLLTAAKFPKPCPGDITV